MSFSPILVFHISGGTLGLLSGAAAMIFRKGSRRHRVAGNIFVVSMLGMATAAVYLAFMKAQAGNLLGGILTVYLVTTGWLTMKRKEGRTSLFDWGALVVALAVMASYVSFGVKAAHSPRGALDGVPAGMYFFMGTVILLSAIGDVRMLVGRGISGTRRLVRHIWRMSFALFIASGSIFLARPHLFPVILRRTYIIFILGILPLILMIFWVIRVRFSRQYRRSASPYRPQKVGVQYHSQPMAG